MRSCSDSITRFANENLRMNKLINTNAGTRTRTYTLLNAVQTCIIRYCVRLYLRVTHYTVVTKFYENFLFLNLFVLIRCTVLQNVSPSKFVNSKKY